MFRSSRALNLIHYRLSWKESKHSKFILHFNNKSAYDICALNRLSHLASKVGFNARHSVSTMWKDIVSRNVTSAIYVSPKDGDSVRILDLDLDLERRLQQPNNLMENLKERNMDLKVFFLLKDYKLLKKLSIKKKELLSEKEDIAHQMALLVKEKNKSPEHTEKKAGLISRGKEIRENLKEIQTLHASQEEKVMSRALKLPADIHPHTPKYDHVIYEIGDKPNIDFRVKNFKEIGQTNKWLSLNVPVSSSAYYFRGDYAELEQALIFYMSNELLSYDVKQISCPDIFKSVVVEGCGTDFTNPDKVYTLASKSSETDKIRSSYHIGGASPMSFAAYFTRMNLTEESLPLSYFTVGRHYSPDKNQNETIIPYHQSSRIELFAATADIDQSDKVFEQFQSMLVEIYRKLQIRTRLVKMSSSSLKRHESARIDIIAWSPAATQYVKIAEISTCSDFISRRLMMKYSSDINAVNQETQYVHTVQGFALSVPDLMTCIVENNQTKESKFVWPECLQEFRFG